MGRISKILGTFALLGLLAGPGGAVEPPFEPELRRLAEILGSLDFLSTLCGREDEGWRLEMERLMDAETASAERRTLFVASFERGYGAFARGYRACTPSAHAAMALLVDEGAGLSTGLAERLGN